MSQPAWSVPQNHNYALAVWMWKYEYRPLNYDEGKEIRLITLHPGGFDDAVRCDIFHTNLLSQPYYEAVSYTWATKDGYSSLSSTIHTSEGYVSITRNCLNALRRLRRRDAHRTLWLDAISINQENISERNHQVSLMRDIYSNASRVLVYIGEATDSSTAIIAPCEGCKDDSSAILQSWKSLAGPLAYPKTTTNIGSISDSWKDRYNLKELFSRRWFQRVGVIQEVALGRRALLIAGEYERELDLPFLENIRERCRRHDLAIPGPFQCNPGQGSELTLRAPTPYQKTKTTLLASLKAARNCFSTDPRDKVFALLSLAEDEIRQAIPVDYSQTTEEIFTRTASAVILHDQDFEILPHARLITGSTRGSGTLPTWAPDWTDRFSYNDVPSQFIPDKIGPWRFNIKIKAKRYDESEDNNDLDDSETSGLVYLLPPQPLLPLSCLVVRAHCIGYINGNAKRNNYWQPAASLADRILPYVDEPIEAWPSDLGWILRGFLSYLPSSESWRINRKDLRDFCEDLSNRGAGKYIFQVGQFPGITSFGEDLSEGDSVWAIDGCRVPMILRATGNRILSLWDNQDDDEENEEEDKEVEVEETEEEAEDHKTYELEAREPATQVLERLGSEGAREYEVQRLNKQKSMRQDGKVLNSEGYNSRKDEPLGNTDPLTPVHEPHASEDLAPGGQVSESQTFGKERELSGENSECLDAESVNSPPTEYWLFGPCFLYGLQELDCWAPGSAGSQWDFDPFRLMEGDTENILIF